MTKIAIILGSTRPGRKAETVGRWVHQHAAARVDATFEIVDLADFGLPHLDEATPPIMGAYEQPHTKAWAATIAAYDGYVFVTPEYNHSTSGALKNAIDFLFAEWNDKACAFVSYGVQGGQRAVEHLRLVAGELKLADVRSQVALTLGTDIADGHITADDRQHQTLHRMLDELTAWSRALAPIRNPLTQRAGQYATVNLGPGRSPRSRQASATPSSTHCETFWRNQGRLSQSTIIFA